MPDHAALTREKRDKDIKMLQGTTLPAFYSPKAGL
jgi:hypothetical protein